MRVLLRKSPLCRKHFFEWLKTTVLLFDCGTSTLKSLLLLGSNAPHVHLRLRKRFSRCTLDCGFQTSESPALRGFEGERGRFATTSLYLVLLSNGQIRGETLRNGAWPGGKHPSQKARFPTVEQDLRGLFSHRPQTPQRSFQEAAAGTHATPAPNRAHSGSHGETRGLLAPCHSKALGCQRNCHRKNSRGKWMHALWRVSAFSGVAGPQARAAWTLLFPQP